MSCQADKVLDGICRLLMPSSLSALAHKDNRQKVSAAEDLMCNARLLCDAHKIADRDKVQLVGKLDIRLVCFLLKKGKECEGKEYKTVQEISEV